MGDLQSVFDGVDPMATAATFSTDKPASFNLDGSLFQRGKLKRTS